MPKAKTAKITKEKKETKKKGALTEEKPNRYFEAVGRRKTSVARVRLFTKGEKGIFINQKPLNAYFSYPYFQKIVLSPLEEVSCLERFRILVKVGGGGLNSQAEAIRHAISRTLILFNPTFKKRLRKVGYLTRDPRMRERKKFGLKRARRAPQWQKR